MHEIDINTVEEKEISGGVFEGIVRIKTLVDASIGSKDFRTGIVTFSPGTRTKIHTHEHEQILYILSGKGIVSTEEKENIATPGKVYLIPAGEKHWHGATEESSFSHLFIMTHHPTQTSY